MKRLNLFCLTVVLAFVVTSCDKRSDAEASADTTAEAEQTAPEEFESGSEPGETVNEPVEKVELAAGGQAFDPAIQPEQLPEGAWYCDMGTVHWAAMAKPDDGKCPECGMALKKLDSAALAKQKEKAVEAHHGHDNGEGDHDGHEDHPHDDDDHGHAH